MAIRNGKGSSNTKSRAVKAKKQAVIDETNNPRQLVTHQKKKKTPGYLMSLSAKIDELFRTPGEAAREEILSLHLTMHGMNPSSDGEQRIVSLLEHFEVEREIEDNDPVSFDDAISRVRQDIDGLFNDIAGDVGRYFFSPLCNAEKRSRSKEELEAQWMSRWINPLNGDKRRMDEWGKLIGFAGEYLVSIEALDLLTNGCSESFKHFSPILQNQIGQAR
jgi:hypothetical protein